MPAPAVEPPTVLSAESSTTPSSKFGSAVVPRDIGADHVALDDVARGRGARDSYPGAKVPRDDVPRDVAHARRAAGNADLVVGCVVDEDPVPQIAHLRRAVLAVTGVALAEEVRTVDVGADVVGLDPIVQRAGALDVNAIGLVGRDDVRRPGHVAADQVARRLDQDALGAIANLVVMSCILLEHADQVAHHLVAIRPDVDHDALRDIASDGVVGVWRDSADRVVGGGDAISTPTPLPIPSTNDGATTMLGFGKTRYCPR